MRLSGAYHVLVAQMAGNHILEKIIVEIVSRTSLIITLYDRPLAKTCPDCDHEDLLRAFEKADARGARNAMLDHLHHIQESLVLQLLSGRTADLNDVFSTL
ncbi:MAG: FCD domain-containing protein [Bordetella sp.]|nr:FCD domain-containing protein [Bordetella sp.]